MRALQATIAIFLVLASTTLVTAAGDETTSATGPEYCVVLDPGNPDPVVMDPDNCHLPTANQTGP